jgi:hypothetical protein
MAVLIYNDKCRPAASVANVSYILRESACHIWATQNLDLQGKSAALSYAALREWEESLRPPCRGAEPRNHSRLLLSFAAETNPEQAMHYARIFLKQKFPDARAILAAHTDTANLHVHVWVDNRIANGNKLHIQNSTYKNLRSSWTIFTDTIYGTNYEAEFTDTNRVRTTKREQLAKRRQGEQEYEQRRVADGEHIIKAANRNIDQANRTIKARHYVANPAGQRLEREGGRANNGMETPPREPVKTIRPPTLRS